MPFLKNSCAVLKDSITIIGYCGIILFRSLLKILQGQVNHGDVLIQIEKFGIGSLPVLTLSAFFIGMALSVQFAQVIVNTSGTETIVGGFISLAMLRELAPVFVAVVMAGHIGSSITAEIGTMKVTKQIDVMHVFPFEELEQLIISRLISVIISGPILSILGAALVISSGQLLTQGMVHISPSVFWESVRFNTHLNDIFNMLIKSLAFSIAIVVIASYNGLITGDSAEAVGESATKSIVWSLLAIFSLNYFLTALFINLSKLS